MEEQLITFETAKLAKEVGYMSGYHYSFIQYHNDYVYDDDPNHPESYKKDEIRLCDIFFHVNNFLKNDFSNKHYTIYEAPTQSLLQKWLREVHNIHVEITYVDQILKFQAEICIMNTNSIVADTKCGNYKEVLEAGINQALNLIENDNNRS